MDRERAATPAARCAQCNCRLTIVTTYECRCEKTFCKHHRHAEDHECDFDHKTFMRDILRKQNTKVMASKVAGV